MDTTSLKGTIMNNANQQRQSSSVASVPQVQDSRRESAATPARPAKPSHDSVARRAYEIYVASGCRSGRCGQNWRQAESELAGASVVADSGSPMAKNFDDVMPSTPGVSRPAAGRTVH